MIFKKINFKEKSFWVIIFFIIGITSLHYSTYMSKWEFHVFYRRLYYIPIILASFKYKLKGGFITSIFIGILYAPHLLLFSSGINISSINQYFEIILFIAIGIITGKLVELDNKKQRLLENKVVEITKLQNYTKNIVDSITAGVVSLDLDLRITSINKEALDLFKIYNSDVNRMKLLEIIEDEKIIDILNQVKVQKTPIKKVKLETILNNKEVYLELNVFPLFDILDRVQGLVMVIEDRSKEKILEAQSIRADRLSTVGELASGVAHEIRNPMGIIKTISQTLKEEAKDEEIKEGLEIIEQEIDRANNVIKSLLSYANPYETLKNEISLNDLLKEILLITEKYVKNQNIKIEYDFSEDIFICGDKEKLKQVFINLILNSVQAIKDSGAINLKTDLEKNWVKIKIEDNGIGIERENLKRIFDPFFTTKSEGTGLGLSIVNRIIEDHDGYITIDSEFKKGSIVKVYLPIVSGGGDE